jgi:hypothetical protein
VYLDGFYHHHNPGVFETFFTPWHAVLYSGMLSATAFLTYHQWRNLRNGAVWSRSLPYGYLPALFGSVIFTIAGVGDFLWHSAFGIEVGLEALISPTHLALASGSFLMLTGPLRSAQRYRTTARGWGAMLPVVLSMMSALSMLTFFTKPFTIIAFPNLMAVAPIGEDFFFQNVQALSGVLIPSALLMGVLLYGVTRWQLPFGSFTLILVGNGLLRMFLHSRETYLYPQVLIAIISAGIAADLLYVLLKPALTRRLALRIFAFSVPSILFAMFFLVMLNTTGIWWSVHLWTGSIFLAGVVGVLMSFLLLPSEHQYEIRREGNYSADAHRR